MEIQSAVYFDSQQSSVTVVTDDGRTLSVPATESNRHYRQLLESGVPIQPYVDSRTPLEQWEAENATVIARIERQGLLATIDLMDIASQETTAAEKTAARASLEQHRQRVAMLRAQLTPKP